MFLSAVSFARTDSISVNEVHKSADTVFTSSKSPWGAVLRSALLPGWGQIYNNSYWKAPIVWGFLGFYYYYQDINDNNYRLFLVNPDPRRYTDDISRQNRDFYRDQRDLFAIYMGITYALNLLDAYVDAQLFDFSVEPDPVTKSQRLSVKFHF